MTKLSNSKNAGRSAPNSARLFLDLGQRRSDVVRMAQTHITPEYKLRIKQEKTGRELLIPLHRDTIEALGAYEMQHVVIIATAYGKSFTVDGFSGWMRDAISEAGLPLDCKPHGLRKAAARLLAEAGATAKIIMFILGHTTLADAERYTEDADQASLAEDAVIKLEGHRANRIAQTASVSLGKTSKTTVNQIERREAGAPYGMKHHEVVVDFTWRGIWALIRRLTIRKKPPPL